MSFFDLIPTPASAVHATLAIWSVPNVRSIPATFWAIRFSFGKHRQLRDRALFDLAIDSKLRGYDIVVSVRCWVAARNYDLAA